MKVLVIYDSVFGNTEKVAQAIGAALGAAEEVSVLRVSEVSLDKLQEIELLVVGSPTRAFQPMPSLTNFLKSLPADVLKGVRVTAFDTRISVEDTKSGFLRFMIGIFGYAASPLAKKLVRKGGILAVAPEGFLVENTEGPMKPGELERAAAWAGGMR